MKAVMPDIPPEILKWRQRTGADQFDEMWEGVLHMAPAPTRRHQDLQGSLFMYLQNYWARPLGAKVYCQINVASIGGWPEDYRIPDLVLLTPERFCIDKDSYFEGPPSVAVEIRSPNDESYEKLSFYEALGIPEVWIIDRDTKQPELYILRSGRYEKQAPVNGWFRSDETGVELRIGQPGKLAIRIAGDDATCVELPEE